MRGVSELRGLFGFGHQGFRVWAQRGSGAI